MKINEKNLAAFASSGTQVDKEGYLMKKGEGSKGFIKRWFVLKGNLLFYFDKKSDKDPLGVIILEGSTVEVAETDSEEHFCFKVTFPAKSYILSASSQVSMEEWIKALACASYDYVKLMADELQRQLDELCKHEADFNQTSSITDNLNAMVVSNANVPTPPPRARITKPSKPNLKKNFASFHEEVGKKILRDQKTRWVREGVSGSLQPSRLVPVQHDDLMHF